MNTHANESLDEIFARIAQLPLKTDEEIAEYYRARGTARAPRTTSEARRFTEAWKALETECRKTRPATCGEIQVWKTRFAVLAIKALSAKPEPFRREWVCDLLTSYGRQRMRRAVARLLADGTPREKRIRFLEARIKREDPA